MKFSTTTAIMMTPCNSAEEVLKSLQTVQRDGGNLITVLPWHTSIVAYVFYEGVKKE